MVHSWHPVLVKVEWGYWYQPIGDINGSKSDYTHDHISLYSDGI